MVYRKEVNELKEIIERHKQLQIRELISPKKKPERLLGINGTLLLLRLLVRSRELLESAVNSFESEKTIAFYILVRAHLETTASLCFFLSKLQSFYSGKVSWSKMDELLGRLSVGSKLKDEGPKKVIFPEPIGIMDALDETDKFLKRQGSDKKMFRPMYDKLSEFHHPNLLGISYNTKVNEKQGTVSFLSESATFSRHSKGGLMKILISASIFTHYYGEAFSLIEKNETMPILKK